MPNNYPTKITIFWCSNETKKKKKFQTIFSYTCLITSYKNEKMLFPNNFNNKFEFLFVPRTMGELIPCIGLSFLHTQGSRYWTWQSSKHGNVMTPANHSHPRFSAQLPPVMAYSVWFKWENLGGLAYSWNQLFLT